MLGGIPKVVVGVEFGHTTADFILCSVIWQVAAAGEITYERKVSPTYASIRLSVILEIGGAEACHFPNGVGSNSAVFASRAIDAPSRNAVTVWCACFASGS